MVPNNKIAISKFEKMQTFLFWSPIIDARFLQIKIIILCNTLVLHVQTVAVVVQLDFSSNVELLHNSMKASRASQLD